MKLSQKKFPEMLKIKKKTFLKILFKETTKVFILLEVSFLIFA